jgi:hypothetical protein
MRVVLKTSLKGTQVWIAGTVFDSADAAIPDEVMFEVRAGSSLVEVLPEVLAPPSPTAPPAPQIEIHMTPEMLPEPTMPPPLEIIAEKEAYHYGTKQKESRSEKGKAEKGSTEEGSKEPQKVVRRIMRK